MAVAAPAHAGGPGGRGDEERRGRAAGVHAGRAQRGLQQRAQLLREGRLAAVLQREQQGAWRARVRARHVRGRPGAGQHPLRLALDPAQQLPALRAAVAVGRPAGHAARGPQEAQQAVPEVCADARDPRALTRPAWRRRLTKCGDRRFIHTATLPRSTHPKPPPPQICGELARTVGTRGCARQKAVRVERPCTPKGSTGPYPERTMSRTSSLCHCQPLPCGP